MAPLIALVVLGQSTTPTQLPNTVALTISGGKTELDLNANSCTFKPTARWTSTTTGEACSSLLLWSTSGTCGDAPAAGDVSYPEVPALSYLAKQGTYEVVVSELPGFSSNDGGVVCGTENQELKMLLCGSVKISTYGCSYPGYTPTVYHASSVTLKYDTRPPTAPELKPLVPLDGELLAQFNVSSDTVLVHAYLKAPTAADFTESGTVSDTANSVRITGLANDVTYQVYLRGEDASQNLSGPSNVQNGTPIQTFGFWAAYRNAGGANQGGCGVTGFELSLAAMLIVARRALGRTRR